MKKQEIAEELIKMQKNTIKTQDKKLKAIERACSRGILRGAALKKELTAYQTKVDILEKQLAAKNENIAALKQAHLDEIRQVEHNLEGTIDQQYSEIQKLRTQLAHATDYEGKFYVFNPLKDKPRKIYDSYATALTDAKAVSRITGGQKILVLKLVSGVEIKEAVEDYSLIPEEEIPF